MSTPPSRVARVSSTSNPKSLRMSATSTSKLRGVRSCSPIRVPGQIFLELDSDGRQNRCACTGLLLVFVDLLQQCAVCSWFAMKRCPFNLTSVDLESHSNVAIGRVVLLVVPSDL